MQPVDVRDEYVEAHAQPVDASTLSSNQFRAHDLATQDLQQLQYLVAQMKDISVQVQEELHTAQEWQPRDYGYILEPDTQQKFKATYREVRKKEKILAKQEKQEKAAARQLRRELRASGKEHLAAVAPLVDDSSMQPQQHVETPVQQPQQQQPAQVEPAADRKARREQQRLQRAASAAAAPAVLQQQPVEQQLQQQPEQVQPQQPAAADAAGSPVVQRRAKQQQQQQAVTAAQQQQPAGRARRRRSSTSAAAAAAGAAVAAPAPVQDISSSSSSQQPEQQPAASRGLPVAAQAAATAAAPAAAAPASPAEASYMQQRQNPKAAAAAALFSAPQPAQEAAPAAASVALSQPLSSSSASGQLGFVPLVLERNPVAARGSAAVRASRRVVRGTGASSSSSRNRPGAAGAAALAVQSTQAPMVAPVPEARKLVDNNVNGLDMRVDLLSAEQERDLASMVQDLLQLEALAKELSTTLGRAPSDFEWMEAAGAAPQPDAGPEDVRAAVQLFQGRLQHGRAAKQLMISANYKLVVSICRKYSGYGLALGDLINEGVAGLVKGVERFEPSKGCKFSTYAHWWIRQGITRSLQEQGRLVRLPSHLQEMLTKMTKVSRAFEAQYGREPTLADLAAELNVEPAKIADAYEAVFTHRSLDQPMGDSEGATLGDVLEDERALGPDDAAYTDSLKHDLEGVLANLPAREAGVLRMRFGLVDGTEHTLDEIGLQFNVTRERIRQIEAKAIRQLRARQLQPGSVIADYQEGSMDSKVLASRTSSGTRKQS